MEFTPALTGGAKDPNLNFKEVYRFMSNSDKPAPEEKNIQETEEHVPQPQADGGDATATEQSPVDESTSSPAEGDDSQSHEPSVTAETVAEEMDVELRPIREATEDEGELIAGSLDFEDDEYTSEEYEALIRGYEETLRELEEGEVVSGRVVHVTEDNITVDVGFKSEGIIPRHEFPEGEEIHVGDEVEVYLERMEDQDGVVVLSKKRADFMRVWNRIKDAYDNQEIVEGTLMRRIKGGIVVNLMGVDAFLPGSQIDLRQVPDMDSLIGQKMRFKVIKLNKKRRNIVISRRVVLEEEREQKKKEIISDLEVGQVREGYVKNITDFGAFIDLGGIDGLLHITDMSWGRMKHPSEIVSIGDKINVKILEFDRERERLSLGLKQLTPHPWENINEKYHEGQRVMGRVVSITDYGAFIEIEKGIEGLIHISEMSWTKKIHHPSQVVEMGDEVEAVILKIDAEEQKISLGLKQTEPDPWEVLEERYPVGSKVRGIVRNLTAFGAFIEIEEGIDGLVHISDMSWTRRIHHPSEVVHKGDEIDVVILGIDKDRRRVSLGIKQLIDDPWDELEQIYVVGKETQGKVVKLLEQGVVVELPDDVEGFVPISHLAKDDLEKPADTFKVDDELPLKVIDFDKRNKRIVLSVKAYFEDKEAAELEEYMMKYSQSEGETLGDVLGDATPVAGTPAEPEAEPTPEETPAEQHPEEPTPENASPEESDPAPAEEETAEPEAE
ncbi:MAG: 30S ribosomal protein S1 [Gemmatimonadetes bacterium]|nr:MAG: 30S ribosomal protein S1 [Gemmatimonadota bacterium]